MTQTNQQWEIVDLFEKYQLSEDLIAKELETDVGNVRATLMQYSGVYKKMHKVLEKKEDKTQAEYEKWFENYKALAENTDDMHLKARITERVMDELKGRKDVELKKIEIAQKALSTGLDEGQQLAIFNKILNRARQQKEKLVEDVVVDAEVVNQDSSLVCI